MRNKENDCIRYLMKEMDPSEELLMEREMMEDEDLLIEVESMRQTLQKLDKLPQLNPPSHVSENILEMANEQAEKNRKTALYSNPFYRYTAAAALALIVTAGSVWVYIGETGSAQNSKTDAVEQAVSSIPSPKNTAAIRFSSTRQQAPSVKKEVKPWVDRNNILRFEDQFKKDNRQFEAILKRSTQKLQLVDQPIGAGQRVKSIHLTGTRK